MTKKIKHLIAIGAVSVITLGSTVPSSAQTIYKKANCTTQKNVSAKALASMRLNCNIKDMILSGNIWDSIVVIPGNSCGNTTEKPEQTPNEKPSVPEQKPDETPSVPEEKPEQTPDETPSIPEEKPEQIPNEKPSVPGEKPEQKPDETPSVPEEKPETSGNFAAFQQKVLQLVNAERAKVGAKPLALNSKLSNVATVKSQDMIDKNYFDHNSPTYGSPFDMMKQFGISYKTAGENIAMGQTSPEEVMNAWMNSSGHRKNILNSSFTEIGVGIAKNAKGQLYWTQMFIGN